MNAARYTAESRLRLTLIESGTNNENGTSITLSPKTFSCEILSLVRYDTASVLYQMEPIINNYDITVDVDNTWFYIVKDLDTGENSVIWDDIIDHTKTTFLRETYEFVLTIKDTAGDRSLTMQDDVTAALTSGLDKCIINVVPKDPTIEDPMAIIEAQAQSFRDLAQNMKELELAGIPTAEISGNMSALSDSLKEMQNTIGILAAKSNSDNIST